MQAAGGLAMLPCRVTYRRRIFSTYLQDTGLFGLYAVVPPEKLEPFMGTVMRNLVRMARDVTPQELDKAKTQLKVHTHSHTDPGPVHSSRCWPFVRQSWRSCS